jgi:hypothetical protein
MKDFLVESLQSDLLPHSELQATITDRSETSAFLLDSSRYTNRTANSMSPDLTKETVRFPEKRKMNFLEPYRFRSPLDKLKRERDNRAKLSNNNRYVIKNLSEKENRNDSLLDGSKTMKRKKIKYIIEPEKKEQVVHKRLRINLADEKCQKLQVLTPIFPEGTDRFNKARSLHNTPKKFIFDSPNSKRVFNSGKIKKFEEPKSKEEEKSIGKSLKKKARELFRSKLMATKKIKQSPLLEQKVKNWKDRGYIKSKKQRELYNLNSIVSPKRQNQKFFKSQDSQGIQSQMTCSYFQTELPSQERIVESAYSLQKKRRADSELFNGSKLNKVLDFSLLEKKSSKYFNESQQRYSVFSSKNSKKRSLSPKLMQAQTDRVEGSFRSKPRQLFTENLSKEIFDKLKQQNTEESLILEQKKNSSILRDFKFSEKEKRSYKHNQSELVSKEVDSLGQKMSELGVPRNIIRESKMLFFDHLAYTTQIEMEVKNLREKNLSLIEIVQSMNLRSNTLEKKMKVMEDDANELKLDGKKLKNREEKLLQKIKQLNSVNQDLKEDYQKIEENFRELNPSRNQLDDYIQEKLKCNETMNSQKQENSPKNDFLKFSQSVR